MNETCYIYIVPFLAGINVEIDPQNHGWIKSEHDYPIQIGNAQPLGYFKEYKKNINHNDNEWSIVFRKYDILDVVSFIIKRSSGEAQLAIDISDTDTIFENNKTECGAIGTVFYIKYILQFFENAEEFSRENNKSCNLFTEESGNNRLRCVDNLYYNFMIDFDPNLSKLIKENIITILSLSEIAYHFQPYMSREELLKNKLNITPNDIVDIFWLYKFLILKCPGSQLFPKFFKNKILIIDNILDYRNKNILENQIAATNTQNKSLTEITKVESGILFLTLFVSVDVIFKVLVEFYDSFSSGSIQLEEIILKIVFLLAAIVISALFWRYIFSKNMEIAKTK
jgi:hypothetical protein